MVGLILIHLLLTNKLCDKSKKEKATTQSSSSQSQKKQSLTFINFNSSNLWFIVYTLTINTLALIY